MSGWSGSFSGLPLCVEEPGTEVRLKEFTAVETVGTVHNLKALVADPRTPAAGLLFMSSLGRAPDFSEPYAEEDARFARKFHFAKSLDDVPIVEACDSASLDLLKNLVVTFDTDKAGGTVRSWKMLYEAEGRTYTTGEVAWQMSLCGSHKELRVVCE